MKYYISACIMLFCIQATAQSSGSGKTADIQVAEQLTARKASFTEVKQELGMPTRESMSPDNAQLEYTTGDITCSFRFDKDRKLTGSMLISKNESSKDLTYETAKQLRKKLTQEEIRSKLGLPSRIEMSNNEENWYYRSGKNNTLLVKFSITLSATTVKKYEYYADNSSNSTKITDQQAEALVKGISTTENIWKKLGEPSKIRVSDQGEEWLYTSGNTMLMVYFDKQSVLNNYMYHSENVKL